MKIGQFIPNIPKDGESEVYGKSRAAYNLSIHLGLRGHDVQVFNISKSKKDSIEYHKDIVIHRFGSLFGYRSERFSFKILRSQLTNDLDIVHIHSGISMTLIGGYISAIKKKQPLVITWHGDSIRDPEMDRYTGIIPSIASYFYKPLVNKILSYADMIISPSESYINKSKFLCKWRDKIVVIPNGINLEEFDIPYSKEECKSKINATGKKVILFVGTLCARKAPDILLKAISMVLKTHALENTLFIFVGGGNSDKYKKLSEELGIEKYIRFTGYIPNNKKPFYYKASDLLVVPSLEECFPLVNLEAMTCGIPVVAAMVGGIPDAVKNGENGLLVRPGNPEELSDAIVYMLQSETERKRMGENGRKKAERYSWAKIAEETEKIYEELV